MSEKYSESVARLLTYGECDIRKSDPKHWTSYEQLNFSKEDIPELIQMALDSKLHYADSESLEVWAPIHAWRILGLLKAVSAVKPLTSLFSELEEDEWSAIELPSVFALIGPESLPHLTDYLGNTAHYELARIKASSSIKDVGLLNSEVRLECIRVIENELKIFDKNYPELNGFLISALIDLEATESLPTIKTAFEEVCVDYSIAGDIEEVEIDLGVRMERTTPVPKGGWLNYVPEKKSLEPNIQKPNSKLSFKKEKKKKKIANKSRKKNKKRK